jgi:hypothetical protein
MRLHSFLVIDHFVVYCVTCTHFQESIANWTGKINDIFIAYAMIEAFFPLVVSSVGNLGLSYSAIS